MDIRVVHCQPGEDELMTIINDVHSHCKDAGYIAHFSFTSPAVRYHYVMWCKDLRDWRKLRDCRLQHIGEAFRCAYGGEPWIDATYVLFRAPVDSIMLIKE